MKRVIIGTAVLVLIVAIVAGQRLWQERQQVATAKAAIQKILDQDAGYTETLLKSDVDSESLSYKEVFDLCDKVLNARTDLLVQLRAINPGENVPVKEQAVAFLAAENDWTRAIKKYFEARSDVATKSAQIAERLLAMPEPAYSEIDAYVVRVNTGLDEIRTAADKLKNMAADASRHYGRVISAEVALSMASEGRGVRPSSFYLASKPKMDTSMARANEFATADMARMTEMKTKVEQRAELIKQNPSAKLRGPAPDPSLLRQGSVNLGRDLFSGTYGVCFSCHGPGGQGNGEAAGRFNPPPTDLTNPAALKYKSAGDRFRIIKYGVAGTVHGGLEKQLNDYQIASLVAYLRVLERN